MRNGIDQRARVGLIWGLQDIGGRPLFDDAALTHDGNMIRHICHNAEIARDQEDAAIVLGQKLTEKTEYLRMFAGWIANLRLMDRSKHVGSPYGKDRASLRDLNVTLATRHTPRNLVCVSTSSRKARLSPL